MAYCAIESFSLFMLGLLTGKIHQQLKVRAVQKKVYKDPIQVWWESSNRAVQP